MKLYEELRLDATGDSKQLPRICSVVVPVFDEEEIIAHLYERLTAMAAKSSSVFEFIVVDDGSKDRSLPILMSIHKSDPRFKIISFSRNFGHQMAIAAGLRYTSGDAVAVIDGDLQDPPELIPPMVAKLADGYDVVFAIRKKRKESLIKRAAYKAFYRLLHWLSSTEIPLDSGDFCVMSRSVVDILNNMPERNKFIRGIRSWVGFRQTGFEYERDRRYVGKPKYNLAKLVNLALDGIISFSKVPLRLAIYLGFSISTLCFMMGLVSFMLRLFNLVYLPGWTSLFLAAMFLGGVQITIMGVIGEYIGRIYDETKHRPPYIITKAIGFDKTLQQPF